MKHSARKFFLISIILSACTDNCKEVKDYVFVPEKSGIILNDGPVITYMYFYTNEKAELSFPVEPRKALELKESDSGPSLSELNSVKHKSGQYTKNNPLKIKLEIRGTKKFDKWDVVVDGVGRYRGSLGELRFLLHKSHTCPLPLDSDPYFISEPITLVWQE